MDTATTSREIYAALAGSPLGIVVAVWPDGSLSSRRDLGVRRRTLGAGMHEEPLVTFVSSAMLPSAAQIHARLDRELAKRAS